MDSLSLISNGACLVDAMALKISPEGYWYLVLITGWMYYRHQVTNWYSERMYLLCKTIVSRKTIFKKGWKGCCRHAVSRWYSCNTSCIAWESYILLLNITWFLFDLSNIKQTLGQSTNFFVSRACYKM